MSESDKEITTEEFPFTISFSKTIYGSKIPRKKRAPRAVKHLRDFVKRHAKVENVIIDQKVNQAIWSRGIQKPPRRIRVKVVKTEEDTAEVFLEEAMKERKGIVPELITSVESTGTKDNNE